MKFNILAIALLVLSALLTTASVSATNPDENFPMPPRSVRFGDTIYYKYDPTSAIQPDNPKNTAQPTTVNESGGGELNNEFTT
ncbi:hypothetical protein IWQ61_010513, partial [Dispira simplex]